MKITSLQNKQVLYWNKLKQKKFRDETKMFLIEGDHLIKEAQKKGFVINIIGLDSSYDFEVTKEILNKLSNQVSGTKEIAVCRKIEEKEISKNGNIILLDDIQDPGNLGTIIRSAVAFHIDTIVLSNNSVDLYNEKVIRASEGMLFHVNILKRDLKEFIKKIKKEGYTLYSTTTNGQGNFEKKEKIAVVIGNEGNGISKEIQALCDKNITIPMDKKCESLNAGVSASIIMYLMENQK